MVAFGVTGHVRPTSDQAQSPVSVAEGGGGGLPRVWTEEAGPPLLAAEWHAVCPHQKPWDENTEQHPGSPLILTPKSKVQIHRLVCAPVYVWRGQCVAVSALGELVRDSHAPAHKATPSSAVPGGLERGHTVCQTQSHLDGEAASHPPLHKP